MLHVHLCQVGSTFAQCCSNNRYYQFHGSVPLFSPQKDKLSVHFTKRAVVYPLNYNTINSNVILKAFNIRYICLLQIKSVYEWSIQGEITSKADASCLPLRNNVNQWVFQFFVLNYYFSQIAGPAPKTECLPPALCVWSPSQNRAAGWEKPNERL